MAGKRVKSGWGWVAATGLVLAPLLLAGCTSGPGGGSRFTLFPDRGTLLESARAVRQPVHPPAPVPRELDERVLPPYTVEPGDSLIVQPADLDAPLQLPGDQVIMPDGTISLGKYGEVIVAGKTVRDIENLVRAVIKSQDKDKDPGPIVVRVVSRVSKVYYVLGEVNSPGAFPLQGREKVLDGIVAAGGLTDRASRVNIILSRPTPPDSCRVVLPVCYREIVQLGDTTTNYQLAPGDRIYVPGRGNHESMFGPGHKKVQAPCCGGPQTACPLTHDYHGAPTPPNGVIVTPAATLPPHNGAGPALSAQDPLTLPLADSK
jgi:protein involved in polysaccharide export with SLBB domain